MMIHDESYQDLLCKFAYKILMPSKTEQVRRGEDFSGMLGNDVLHERQNSPEILLKCKDYCYKGCFLILLSEKLLSSNDCTCCNDVTTVKHISRIILAMSCRRQSNESNQAPKLTAPLNYASQQRGGSGMKEPRRYHHVS